MIAIKFRGMTLGGEWVYGNLAVIKEESENLKVQAGSYISNSVGMPFAYAVRPETVGQYTGLKDKHGKDIYEGDTIQYRKPYRTTQTHTGDNIPNGSYTEPMEPAIKTVDGDVFYKDGCYQLETGGIDSDYPTPFVWDIQEWDEEGIKDAIAYHKPGADIWDDPEEGDLQYLLQEYKLKDLAELIEYIRGVEIIGNIHDNQE